MTYNNENEECQKEECDIYVVNRMNFKIQVLSKGKSFTKKL